MKDGTPMLKTWKQRDYEREVIEQIAWLVDHSHQSVGAIGMRVYNLAPLKSELSLRLDPMWLLFSYTICEESMHVGWWQLKADGEGCELAYLARHLNAKHQAR